jgi:hypothetical protein
MPQSTARQKELAEKRTFWEGHLKSWKSGTLSQKEYCRRHNLVYHRFVYWRCKFKSQASDGLSLVRIFPPRVVPPPVARRASLRVVVGKFPIEVDAGFDPLTLKKLICALERI